MLFRLELTYSEVDYFLDIKYFVASSTGSTSEPGNFEFSENISMLKSLLSDIVKVKITIDDIRLKSNFTSNKTITITKTSFFNTVLGFIQSHSRPSVDVEGFVSLIPGSQKSEKPNIVIGIDKVCLNCNCIDGCILNGLRQIFLFSFASDKPPGHKIYKEPRAKLFKKIKKICFTSYIILFEDDDHKPVDFNEETLSFTYLVVKM